MTLGAVEDIVEFEQIGLIGDDLLQPERPLLVPRPRQAERLVPRRQLHGAGAGLLRGDHGEHGQKDAIDVVLWLLLGQAERVDLHAVAEAPQRRIGHAVALLGDLVPQIDEGAHLAHLGDEADAGIDEEADAADHARKIGIGDFTGCLDLVEHGLGGGEREGELLGGRGSRLLQMIGADIGGIPFRHHARGVDDHVLDQPQRRRGREHIGAAREIFLEDVVLHRAGELGAVCALLVGERDIEREQPGGRGVDGHGGVHLGQGDALEQAAHVAEMGDRARRPCPPRRGRADRRNRSPSGWADRRRPRGRSDPWPGSCGRARSRRAPSNGPHRCGTSRACRACFASCH